MCKKILLTIQQHAIAEPIGISSLLWKSNDIRCAGPWLSPCLRICPSAIEMLCWKNAAPWDVECRIYSYEFGSLLRCVQCFPTNPLFCRKAQSINLWAFCACLESCISIGRKAFSPADRTAPWTYTRTLLCDQRLRRIPRPRSKWKSSWNHVRSRSQLLHVIKPAVYR